ncbi:MAG TPA: DUF2269 domain-containing protein [Noviherbaspirillum sp.]|jgi:uncharacterized membrane protein|uniref:DUF2269 family protein n=1 Tax=Noviherbaspirillum sp. TaxID=1926288 RepID=UPI002F931D8C
MDYVTLKWLHIMSSTFLFGTGVGSAFYMLFASLARDVRAVAFVTRYVVIADWLFTATTAVIQPLTGWLLIRTAGFPMNSRWIMWSIGLYALAIACWLPVVWLQMRLRDVAARAAAAGQPLPPEYWRYLRIWVLLGIPAFFAFVIIFYLMVAKPA